MRIVICLSLLSAGLIAQVEAISKSQGLPKITAPFQDSRLGAVVGHIPSLDFTHRHVHISGNQVQVAPVVGDEKILGFYFKGSVKVDYRSDNTLEFPRLDYNLRKNTPLNLVAEVGSRSFSDLVREGIVWSPEIAATVLKELKGGAPSPEMEASFQAFKGRNEKGNLPPTRFDLAMTGVGAEPIAIEMLGDRRWLYEDDTKDSGEESLNLLYGWWGGNEIRDLLDDQDLLWSCIISRQRNDRGWKQLDRPPYLLTHVQMDLKALRDDKVKLIVEETFLAMRPGLQTMKLDLENAFFSMKGVHSNLRHLNLRSVKDSQGRPVPFEHRSGEIFIQLPEAPALNQSIKLAFEIDGDFLIRWDGDNKWDLRPGAWFPQPNLNGQYYTIDARIAVQKPFLPCASANTVSRFVEDDFNVLVAKNDKPSRFFSVTAGNFKFSDETRKGVTVRVANYAQAHSQTPRVIGLTFDVIEFYETILGPFPVSELTIVEQNDWGYGQAPPGLIFITKEAFGQVLTLAHRVFSKGINARFAHEIAHQYWGHQVKWPNREEQWISEAFAEYSAALFMARARGKDYYEGMLQEWWNGAEKSNSYGVIPFANEIRNQSNLVQAQEARTNLIYNKGAFLLHCLHEQIGFQNFVTFLRSTQASFRWKFANTAGLIDVLKAVTKQDYSEFFNQNIWGQGLPERKRTTLQLFPGAR